MYNKFLKGQIKLEEMTSLEFTQLISEWKQKLFRHGAKNANKIVIDILKSSLKDFTNVNVRKNIINYLRSV